VLVSCFGSWPSKLTAFSHSFDPSARFRHHSDRFFPFSVDWVRKILSPQTMGVELPLSGSAIFHLTFLEGDHSVGKLVSVESPWPVGPRQAGQFSALVKEDARKKPVRARRNRLARIETPPGLPLLYDF